MSLSDWIKLPNPGSGYINLNNFVEVEILQEPYRIRLESNSGQKNDLFDDDADAVLRALALRATRIS